MKLPHLATRLFNTPLLIMPSKLDAILAGLGPRFGIEDYPLPETLTTHFGERKKPGYRVIDGVGVLDVFGLLAHRGRMDAESNYILGYQDVARQLDAALADSDVRGILLNLDSPGGEVSGAFDLAGKIRAARAVKPIRAVAGDLAASAAYLLAAATGDVSVTQTGNVGSIGVVLRHVDMSRAADQAGLTVTHIFAGAKKIAGNPFEPLPDAARADLQAHVDKVYALFAESVAADLGLPLDVVRGTEASIYLGQDAVHAGLARRIATPDEIIAEMSASFSPKRQRGKSMSVETEDAALQAAITEARAGGFEAGNAEGLKAGAAAERERIGAILAHQETAGRESLSRTLALETDLSAEQAGKILAASPKEAAQPGNSFAQAMNALGNPTLGADGAEASDDASALAARVVSFLPKRA